jgi:hypothetical protein
MKHFVPNLLYDLLEQLHNIALVFLPLFAIVQHRLV